jgi:peptidoglycan pentaglycine glycine transferase (the first glycine)
MDFLQSNQWRNFQESVGRKTFLIDTPKDVKSQGDHVPRRFYASIIEHTLPVVGRYFYVPRGPVLCHLELAEGSNLDSSTGLGMTKLIDLAKENKVGWIRIEPENEEILEKIKKATNYKIQKAPHDMQPKEIFVIDIYKSEEEILAGMKEKTRYNIRLAEKKGVNVFAITNNQETITKKYVDEFLRLVKVTSERDGITSHPEDYYRKMLETIPAENIKLYVAEYENKIIAANFVIFYENIAIYLHGASDNEYRNVMAPYLVQWQAIKDAKSNGCKKYDFGGISTNYESNTNIQITNKWAGITKFKQGFSKNTQPTEFPGSYDVILNYWKYNLYKIIQKIKSFV